jgi:hypothetical protein
VEVKLAGKASLPVILVKSLDAANQDLWTRKYSIGPDGRILFLRPVSKIPKPAEIQIIVNWAKELRRISPMP